MQNDEMLLMIKEFSNVFNEFYHETNKFIDAQLKKTGLVRTHFGILHELAGGKELSMSDLSELLHVTKPNVTVLIDKLVTLNYVERISSNNDRRVIFIRITEKGKIFINKSSEALIKSSAKLLDNFDEQDLELVKEATQTMRKLLLKFNKE